MTEETQDPARQRSFGVFKPVGHVLASFADAARADAAQRALQQRGMAAEPGAMRHIGPAEMSAQANADLASASPLAWVGQDANLVRAQADLAQLGYHFLLIKADDHAHAVEIAETARAHGAERAQHYGHLIVEELIEHQGDRQQVAESPDRGLDAQTRSGDEAERAALRPGARKPG